MLCLLPVFGPGYQLVFPWYRLLDPFFYPVPLSRALELLWTLLTLFLRSVQTVNEVVY